MEYKLILGDRYKIFENGTVINLKRNTEVKFSQDSKGYLRARLYTSESKHTDGRKPFKLHRLVAKYFLSNYSEELQVNHKDGNKSNNVFSNLEMMNNSENAYHGWNVLDSTERKNKLNARRLPNGRFN
jgi:hypothetical protein